MLIQQFPVGHFLFATKLASQSLFTIYCYQFTAFKFQMARYPDYL